MSIERKMVPKTTFKINKVQYNARVKKQSNVIKYSMSTGTKVQFYNFCFFSPIFPVLMEHLHWRSKLVSYRIAT